MRLSTLVLCAAVVVPLVGTLWYGQWAWYWFRVSRSTDQWWTDAARRQARDESRGSAAMAGGCFAVLLVAGLALIARLSGLL